MWRLICMSQALAVQRGECLHARGANGQAHWSSCLLVLPCCLCRSAKRRLYCLKSSLGQQSAKVVISDEISVISSLYLVHCSAERTLQRFVLNHIDSWNQGEFFNSMSILAQTATFKIYTTVFFQSRTLKIVLTLAEKASSLLHCFLTNWDKIQQKDSFNNFCSY